MKQLSITFSLLYLLGRILNKIPFFSFPSVVLICFMQRLFCKIDYMTGNPLDFNCFSPLFDADKDISTAGGSASESPPRTPFQEIIFEIAFFL